MDKGLEEFEKEIKDLYLYPETDIMKNKFNVKDNEFLSKIEGIIVDDKLRKIEEQNFEKAPLSVEQIKNVHKYLFEEVYPFAGEFRTIQIYKAERELGGQSFEYCNPRRIEKELEEICKFYETLSPSNFPDGKIRNVGRFAAKVWAVHPFREGNTRTTMCMMINYAKKLDLELDISNIEEDPKKFRDALLLHSLLGQYSEPEKLREIIKESIEIGEKNKKLGIVGEAKVIESAKSSYNLVTGKYIPVAEKLPEYKTNAWITEKQIDKKIKIKEDETP